MNEVIAFLRQWYREIVAALAFLVLVIIGLCKKKTSVVDTIKEVILENLPHFINSVERPGHGSEKLEEVVQLMVAFLNKLYPGIQITQYLSFIRKSVKGYLSTPQEKKKG